nr:hypothetical protein [Lachnospiraceae bacterium]
MSGINRKKIMCVYMAVIIFGCSFISDIGYGAFTANGSGSVVAADKATVSNDTVKTEDTNVKGEVATQGNETLTDGLMHTLFLTEGGKTAYTDFVVSESGLYRVCAYSTAKSISLLPADQNGEVFDIIDSVSPMKINKTNYYCVSDIRYYEKGTYKIGVAANKVAKYMLSAKKLPSLSENTTFLDPITPSKLIDGYIFTPTESRQYQFYCLSKCVSEMSLCTIDGKFLKEASSMYIPGCEGMLFKISYKLNANEKYYIKAVREYDFTNDESVLDEITVSRALDTNGEILEEDKLHRGKIGKYHEKDFYVFTPSKSGKYFFDVSSETSYYPRLSVFDENENLICEASVKKEATDSDGITRVSRQAAVDMKSGKTYYVRVRLNSYQSGAYTIRARKMENVDHISVVHKPAMKKFIKNLDLEYRLKGTVLAIHFKGGRTAKWTYRKKASYIEGCPVKTTIKSSKKNMQAVFKYRGKKVKISIPVYTIPEYYKDAPTILEDTSRQIKLRKNKLWSFVKLTGVNKKTLYRIYSRSNKDDAYRVVVFDEKGNMVRSFVSHYTSENISKDRYRYYMKANASLG